MCLEVTANRSHAEGTDRQADGRTGGGAVGGPEACSLEIFLSRHFDIAPLCRDRTLRKYDETSVDN